ncbi:MAG: hypothetical protein J0I41_09950 [Filimonas sp.]|nr:hypothetical protein [Filimonas sp.]
MRNLFTASAILLSITGLLSSCATTSYMGDKLPPTSNVDVFYASKDVKKEYKVIGHIYAPTTLKADKIKESILTKAKNVGADGVIILGIATAGSGKDSETIQQADVIKYLGK